MCFFFHAKNAQKRRGEKERNRTRGQFGKRRILLAQCWCIAMNVFYEKSASSCRIYSGKIKFISETNTLIASGVDCRWQAIKRKQHERTAQLHSPGDASMVSHHQLKQSEMLDHRFVNVKLTFSMSLYKSDGRLWHFQCMPWSEPFFDRHFYFIIYLTNPNSHLILEYIRLLCQFLRTRFETKLVTNSA